MVNCAKHCKDLVNVGEFCEFNEICLLLGNSGKVGKWWYNLVKCDDILWNVLKFYKTFVNFGEIC